MENIEMGNWLTKSVACLKSYTPRLFVSDLLAGITVGLWDFPRIAKSRATTARETIGRLRRRERRCLPVSRLLHGGSAPRSRRPSLLFVSIVRAKADLVFQWRFRWLSLGQRGKCGGTIHGSGSFMIIPKRCSSTLPRRGVANSNWSICSGGQFRVMLRVLWPLSSPSRKLISPPARIANPER